MTMSAPTSAVQGACLPLVGSLGALTRTKTDVGFWRYGRQRPQKSEDRFEEELRGTRDA